MQLEIVHPGRYTAPETFVQTTLFVHVGLCLGGLDYMNIAPPGGGGAAEADRRGGAVPDHDSARRPRRLPVRAQT